MCDYCPIISETCDETMTHIVMELTRLLNDRRDPRKNSSYHQREEQIANLRKELQQPFDCIKCGEELPRNIQKRLDHEWKCYELKDKLSYSEIKDGEECNLCGYKIFKYNDDGTVKQFKPKYAMKAHQKNCGKRQAKIIKQSIMRNLKITDNVKLLKLIDILMATNE